MKAPRSLSEEPVIGRILELALHVTAGEEARISLFLPQHTFSRLRSAAQDDQRKTGARTVSAPIEVSGAEAAGEFVVVCGRGRDLQKTVHLLAAMASDALASFLGADPQHRAPSSTDNPLIDMTWHLEMKQALAPRDYLEMARRWTELTIVYEAKIRLSVNPSALTDAAAGMHEAARAFGATKLAEVALRLQCNAAQGADCLSDASRLGQVMMATHLEIERINTGALWDVVWKN